MTYQEFVDKFYSYAEIAGKALNDNPYFILAQWYLETGGKENSSYNLAGIGAFDNPLSRQTIYGTQFKNYMDFTDTYIKLIKANYPKATNAKSINDFANGLESGKFGKWATDPNYAQKIVQVYDSMTGSNVKYEGGSSMPSWFTNAVDGLKISAVYIVLVIAVIFIIFYSGKEILK